MQRQRAHLGKKGEEFSLPLDTKPAAVMLAWLAIYFFVAFLFIVFRDRETTLPTLTLLAVSLTIALFAHFTWYAMPNRT